MSMNILATAGIQLLKLGLEAATLRQAAISNNIANVNTDGYRPLKVSFEEQLRALSASRWSQSDLSSIKPSLVVDEHSGAVALDEQMVMLNQNYVYHQSLLKALNGKLELFGTAINDARR
jgi:flagellar basal-body rod protein FlgB